ncbi:unnamed protein product [Linum tenue]|uniref:Uncharacterized protein n=1 Tax=Linum tenue TaxID=586396 RepID=A0AAV0S3I1_9ROSI|nr:unnamed protein product [Linum tenue]
MKPRNPDPMKPRNGGVEIRSATMIWKGYDDLEGSIWNCRREEQGCSRSGEGRSARG